MYAVIQTSGHQYRVSEGQTITVDRRPGLEDGAEIVFDQVLLVAGEGGTQIGTPVLSGATVTGELVEQYRDKKIIVRKFRRRKNYRRKKGHRQHFATVRITGISAGA